MVNILEQPEDKTQNPRAVRRIAFLIRHIYSQLSGIFGKYPHSWHMLSRRCLMKSSVNISQLLIFFLFACSPKGMKVL